MNSRRQGVVQQVTLAQEANWWINNLTNLTARQVKEDLIPLGDGEAERATPTLTARASQNQNLTVSQSHVQNQTQTSHLRENLLNLGEAQVADT